MLPPTFTRFVAFADVDIYLDIQKVTFILRRSRDDTHDRPYLVVGGPSWEVQIEDDSENRLALNLPAPAPTHTAVHPVSSL